MFIAMQSMEKQQLRRSDVFQIRLVTVGTNVTLLKELHEHFDKRGSINISPLRDCSFRAEPLLLI